MDAAVSSDPDVFAVIGGKPVTSLPKDLFIPPDALEILLDGFSGPLDLLWYLIRKQNMDVMNIPIVLITKQYMDYIAFMEFKRLELAADYLVMAAWLAEIKSRLLLPIPPSLDPDEAEADPRMALVKRLQVYEQFKQVASLIDELPRVDRDVFRIGLPADKLTCKKPLPSIQLVELVDAFKSLLTEQSHFVHHQIAREVASVSERMCLILARIQSERVMDFSLLFIPDEGRMGLVVSLLAILELARQSLIIIEQHALYGRIDLEVVQ